MPEFIMGMQSGIIIFLILVIVSQNARLMRAAMSRTPGEFRAAEKAAKAKPQPTPKNLVETDEAVALVLQSVTSGSPGANPMPHGLGGD